jgi:YfiH family protein
VVVLEQVHGDSVLEVDGEQRPGVHAAGKHDALVTIRKDVALGIKTADCAPVLLYDAATGAMAAVHAGWKGTAIGIAARTVEAMSRLYGSRPGDIAAVIGPCIRPCCYPVGDDVADAFEKAFGKDGHLIGGDRRADMQAANRTWLERAGVLPGKIGVISLCTSCHPDLFFSHRRDNGVTGRHLNFITGA